MTPGIAIRLVLLALLVAFLAVPQSFAFLLQPLTKDGQSAIYVQNALLNLALSHLAIVAIATLAASVIAIGLAILVSRPAGAEFLPLSRTLANVGQTFPPVAVLALAVPVLGFGTAPTLVALFLYGLLPIFENALTGLTTIPPQVEESARASGMTELQRLVQVDLPLATPLIIAGIRLSVVIGIGTATIGSTVAASTLGETIIAGLINNNLAFVVQGGVTVGVIAILASDALGFAERWAMRRSGRNVPGA